MVVLVFAVALFSFIVVSQPVTNPAAKTNPTKKTVRIFIPFARRKFSTIARTQKLSSDKWRRSSLSLVI
jgi:hypothetical protein